MSNNLKLSETFKKAGIVNADLEKVLASFNSEFIKKGQSLLQEGQYSNHYYWIEDGLVRTFAIDTTGNDITTGFYGSNQIILEPSSFFLHHPTKENIEATTDCICWKTNFETFQILFNEIAPYREWGRTHLVKRLVELKQRSLSRITDSAKSRYIHLTETAPEILAQAPLKHIASYLGITDTSLSRIRKELSNN